MSSNTTKKPFTIKSYFANEYASKWDNLLIYKNGFLDDFSTNESIKSFLKNPKGIENKDQSSQSFVKEFEKTLLKTKNYDFETIGLVNTIQEERPFSFDFKVKAQVDFLNKDKRISNNTFVYKIHPDKNVQITLSNADKLLIAENFSQIDFSKPSTSLGSFVSIIEEEIKDTYDNDKTDKGELFKYNNKDFKNFYDNIKKLFHTENDDDFSSTLGFCVKSLTVEDLLQVKEEINKKSFNKLKSIKKEPVVDYFLENKNLDITITNMHENNVYSSLKENLYTTFYFSCFKNNTNDTHLRRNYSSDLVLSVSQSNSNENKTSIKLVTNDIKKDFFEITPIDSKDLKEKLRAKYNFKLITGDSMSKESIFNTKTVTEFTKEFQATLNPSILTHRRNIGGNARKVLIKDKVIKTEIKQLASNIDFITEVEYSSNSKKLRFKLEYVLLNQYDPRFTSALNSNEISRNNYNKYHFFEPVICLETINGPSFLLDIEEEATIKRDLTFSNLISNNEVLKNKESEINSNGIYQPESIIATKYETYYSISPEKIFEGVMIKDNKNMFSLKNYYHNKFFYVYPSPGNNQNKSYNKIEVKNSNNNTETFYTFSEDKISLEDLGLSGLSFTRSSEINKETKINPSESSLTEQNRPAPKKSSLKGQKEKVLYVTDNIKTETQRKSEKQKNNTSESSSYEHITDAVAELKKINDIKLIDNWFALNGVSRENPRGTAIKSKNKKIIINFFDAYQARRGNVQPKLLKIIESAYTLTKKVHPRLDAVHITSTSSCPVELWVEAADLINTHHTNRKNLVEKLNKLGFYNVNNSQEFKEYSKNIYNIIERSSENVQDLNHNLGFAVDLYLTINDPNAKKPRRICIYEPKEDLEFKIFKYFIEMCFKLGANSIGAGMYYMDYPHYETYNKKTGNDGKYKKDLNHHKKIIVDDNLIPIRRKGTKYNAIHVDIIGYNDEVKNLKEIADTGELKAKRIAEYVTMFKNSNRKARDIKKKLMKGNLTSRLGKDFNKITDDKIVSVNKRHVELFKGFITNDDDLESTSVENSKLGELKEILSRKGYSKSYHMVWGSSGSQKSADTWLFKAADRTRPTSRGFSKVFDNNEITVDNFKESSVIHFIKDLENKKKKDFIDDSEEVVDITISGDSKLFTYIVKESDLKKINNK